MKEKSQDQIWKEYMKKPCHWCGAVGDEEHSCGDPEPEEEKQK